MGSHTLPKYTSSCHRPQAGTAWRLVPFPVELWFPGAGVTQQGATTAPLSAAGAPQSHWWQAQSSSTGYHRDTAAPGSSLKKQLRAKMLLPVSPRKVPEAKSGPPGTQSLSSCLCLGRQTWTHMCKRENAAAVKGLKINSTWPLMQQCGFSCFHSPV